MNEARWSELEAEFSRLAEASAEERRARLAELAPDLAAELGELLALHDQPELLAIEARREREGASGPRSSFVPGGRLGPYELVEPLGEGGMGEVWLAERDEAGFRRRVAIKRIRTGLASAELLRRFQVERHALARLSHRSIARLLDGGETADGEPFVVLEYVAGQPITTACAERRLGLDARLALFEEICRAVAYAHAHLVVHRDIKPSNILLTPEGEVRLLDFGIAKLLDDAADGPEARTRTAHTLATPEYASPEQLSATGVVSTATDVHALGALLYELVAGQRAFRAHETSPVELASAILQVEPPPPSQVAPRELARALRGDLDTIVLTALRKEPERRYPSVEQLAEDVARFRSGHPIRARPETLAYRARKLVARHRLAFGLGLGAAVVLAGLAVQTVRERDTARAERDAAREVTEFLVSLFDADPYASGTQATSATPLGTFLTDSESAVRERLADRPELRARLLMMLGRLHANLGELESAGKLAAESLAERRRLFGNDHPDVAEALNILGTAQQENGELDAADRSFREALAIRERRLGADHADTAESLNNLAVLLSSRRGPGDLDEAVVIGSRALESYRRRFGNDHLDTAQALNNQAVRLFFRRAAGDLEIAASNCAEALEIRRKHLGEDHPLVATARHNLANMRLEQGDATGAVALLELSIGQWERTLGPGHPRVARGYLLRSKAFERLGDRPGALVAARKGLAISVAALPADHPQVAELKARVAELEAKPAGAGSPP
ncbi:MAG: serine/threonine-protein kinase [Thermoanaerobaculia bacterium]|nr:serine/threonine-protein kinase [Thermoanaerobaculia bacterium]